MPVRFVTAVILASLVGCGASKEVASQGQTDRHVERTATGERVARIPRAEPVPKSNAQRDGDWFEDVTERTSIQFAYRNGVEGKMFTLLETVGGGVALLDFDNDGDLDLFVTGGGTIAGPTITVAGRPSAMFRNEGDWRFTDVTTALQLDTSAIYSHGCAVGDYDRDGFSDLLVTGFGGCQLWRNDGGKRFVLQPGPLGLMANEWTTSAVWFDANNDGWLDLFVATYADWQPGREEVCLFDEPGGKYRDVCSPSLYHGTRDRLWINRQDGSFDAQPDREGLAGTLRSLGVIAADFDDDGWQDLYVTNDVQENQLFWTAKDWPLNEEAALAGAAYSPLGAREGSMGVDVADFNHDHRPDLFYTNFSWEDNSLLLNDGARGFRNLTSGWGLSGPSRQWVGFGCAAADFDGDSWPDLFVTNGHVLYDYATSPYYQPSQLFRNAQGQRFVEVGDAGGTYFRSRHVGRGVAVGDMDNNGTLDLVVVHQNDPLVLLKNRLKSPNWQRVRLRGATSNLEAIGSRVAVHQEGESWTQWVRGGGSYLSHSDVRCLFSLPRSTTTDIAVRWPSGLRERFFKRDVGQEHVLVEGTGIAEP